MCWWRKAWESYWLRFLGGSVLLLFGLPSVLQRANVTKDYGEGVLVGTGVAIIWYAVEAWSLRRETVRQTEIGVQPFVIANIEPRQLASARFEPELVVKNVGNGLAMFIHFHDMALVDPAGDRVPFTVRFQALSHLEKGQECHIQAIECVPGKAGVNAEHLDPVQCLDPQQAVETYTMRIEYQDILGRGHWTEVKMGKDGIGLVNHS